VIYLRTGANGTCKTLFTLADVRKLQLESGRPVCVNGRFKLKPEKMLEFGWKVIDFKDWQAQDDGTIFLIDECHNDMPLRPNSSPVPEPIRMLAEHRARGFDFFLLTQHPMNIDAFVRKIIGAPGWHQHLKRVFGGANVTRVLQWDAVRSDCEKDGSGKSAQITTRTHPKEVYGWYDSASLHTAKRKIPFQVWVLLACLVIVPALGFVGYRYVHSMARPVVAAAPAASAGLPAAVTPSGDKKPPTASEFAASLVARIDGLPQTATRYDELTKPTVAPYPAACVHMGSRCQCYTQQATRLPTSPALCEQIVKFGMFMDWDVAKRDALQNIASNSPVSAESVPVSSVGASLPTSSPGDGSGVAAPSTGRQGGGLRRPS